MGARKHGDFGGEWTEEAGAGGVGVVAQEEVAGGLGELVAGEVAVGVAVETAE